MDSANSAIEPSGQAISRREAVWFILGALVFILIEIAALRGWAMVTKPFWLDEVTTYLVSGTQSLAESMRNLAAGADSNPPTALLFFRAVALIAGGLSPTAAHVAGAACVLGALTTVYLLLRTRFSSWPSALGAMAVWAQQVVMHAAFDARFYGILLFLSGCLLLILLRTMREKPTALSAVTLAVVSAALCTVHYFGILTWGTAVGTVVLFAPTTFAVRLRRLAPSLAGPIALAACAPFYLGQRASITIPTWMSDPTFAEAVRLLAVFLLTMPLAIALLCWALIEARAWLARRRGDQSVPRPFPDLTMRPFALGPLLLATQVAVPLVLMAFSVLIQPATEPRYWIAGTLATAPVVALIVSRGDVLIRSIATLGMIGASVKTIRGEVGRAEAFAQRVREDVQVASGLAQSGALVVARRRDTVYPVVLVRPELKRRLRVLDSTPLDSTNRFFIIERDLGRINTRLYGLPAAMTPAELSRVQSFYFMEPASGDEATGAPTSQEFPEHAISRVGDRVFRLTRRPADQR